MAKQGTICLAAAKKLDIIHTEFHRMFLLTKPRQALIGKIQKTTQKKNLLNTDQSFSLGIVTQ